jgi:2-iminobutanoate/2-iminopropanoate deaminase
LTTTRRQALNPPTSPAPVRSYYSNAIKVSAGNLLFIAGQVSIDRDGQLVGAGDPAAQCEQILKNIAGLCEAAGATLADVIKVTVFVTDMDMLPKLAPVRTRYFPKDGPASTLVEVRRLVEPEWLLEIDAVVAIP